MTRLGPETTVDRDTWRLRFWGQLERPAEWNWEELLALPRVEIPGRARGDSATRHVGARWTGVASRQLLGRVRLLPDAAFVLIHGAGGARSNLALCRFADAGTVFVHHRDGAPLEAAGDGPLRLVVGSGDPAVAIPGVWGVEFLNKDWPSVPDPDSP